MDLVEYHHALNRPERPVCSICVANYNGVGLLDDCLASILVQQGEINIEIIVHDDASTDDSVALLREKYPGVEVIASRENVGFCVANNRMVAQARGEYVLLLNNDAALYPDALLTLLQATRLMSPAGILSLPQYGWETDLLVDRGYLLDPFYNPVPNFDPDRHDIAMVVGACLWVARDLWNELGGFPEWMESLGEDLYFCCVSRLRGRPLSVVGASGYRHRQGASFGGSRVDAGRLNTTFRRRRLSERNKTAALIICTPTWFAWPLLLIHLMELAIEGTAVTIWRRDKRIWNEIYRPAFKDTFGRIPNLRSLRRQHQALRRVSFREYFDAFTWLPRKLTMLYRHGLPTIR